MYESTAGTGYLDLENLRTLLSRPTQRRSTPIATTALPFMIRLDPECAMEMRIAG
jgi:hypothetical protein